ncbi:MAG TPA: YdbH domain-containing protein [Rhizomicrobium sp.]|nr:YdbH domain-containing protein [Rhizomicrobium sp.]
MKRRWLAAIPLVLVAIFLLLWLARSFIAVEFARSYFRSHGVESAVEIGSLGLSGVSGRFALGPKAAPEISAERIELYFDPLRWLPYVVEVRLVNPVVRAGVDEKGKTTLGSLQDWIDSLNRQQGKSRFVSDDLAVALTGLRLLLTTPAGALDVGGDIKLVKNLPVSARLQARPAHITRRDWAVRLRTAGLTYEQQTGILGLRFSGAVKNANTDIQNADIKLDAVGLQWRLADKRLSVSAPSAHLQATASSVAAGQRFDAPNLDLSLRNIRFASGDGNWDAAADLALTAAANFSATLAPLQAADPALANAIRRNLARVTATLSGHAEKKGNALRFAQSRPLVIAGARGGALRVSGLTLSGSAGRLQAAWDARLRGPGLPAVTLGMRNMVWSGGGFTGDAALSARFHFAMLRGAAFSGRGKFSWQNGQYAFTSSGCVRATLAAFRPGASDMAKNVRSEICAPPQQPLLTGEGIGWTLTGQARNASADLPLATVHAENVVAGLNFDGEGAPLKGTATVTAGRVLDRAASLRFKPLFATGTASLAKGVWTGRFAATDSKRNALGEAAFTHTMATGTGTAHISAPHITFAPNRQQPADLSPLLVGLRNAEGRAAFAGDINWTRDAMTSQGKLSIDTLDFMTVLGKAHAVKSEIAFTSLLPPVTASGQGLTISRIDWTIPFSAVDVRFAFSPATLQISKADTDIAEGHASLGAISISLANPGHVAGAAQLTSVSLNSLVTASNLGSKVKLEGKVSGRIPFAIGAEGFRITNGHVAADGPGRLSIDRSMWTDGLRTGGTTVNSSGTLGNAVKDSNTETVAVNAVQDFAYQALENLAFDQMSADLNSIANGRLQIVFRIKGRSDPPKPQVAEVAVTDIINGTALYKPIPLPSGTPIDLTLDTSLNFDELLKSYAQAWSKTLDPEGRPDK